MASNPENLYVTFVDVDHDLLKIWGQRNRIGATYIERQLLQLIPEFNRTHCPSPSRITKGMFCFAKYTDDNYYRARVISNVQGNSVGVAFIDYGNKDIINLSNIRIQEGNEGDVLVKMAEQAEEYYMARIAAPSYGWTRDIISEIRRDICNEEFPYHVLDQVGDQKILEIQFHNEDFSNYLVKKQFARPLSLPAQKQLILSYCSLVSNDGKRDTHFREMNFSNSEPIQNPVPPFMNRNHGNEIQQKLHFEKPANFPYPPPSQYPPAQYQPLGHSNSMPQHVDKSGSKNVYFSPVSQPRSLNQNSSPSVNPSLSPILGNQYNAAYQMKGTPPYNNVLEVLAQQVKQYIAEDNAKAELETQKTPHTYINSVLEVGSMYNVIVSYIDDGPWSFSIQFMSSEEKLKNLMTEISSCELVPIKPPIILGHSCIALSALYKTLCRGVVVSISHVAVKVYFVDFGNTEDLLSSSIYELPPKFFKTRVLSQKFSLSGLQKVTYSDDIKKFFKEVVQDEVLMLRVTSLEDDNLPTCELYKKDTNIKRILNEKIRELRSMTQEDYLKAGDSENVIVTWVVNPQKFYVQLRKRDPEITALKKELSEVEERGLPLSFHQLSVGLKCVCKYETDGQWYRAVVTSIDSENEITVFYVDYGNTEVVKISLLRKVNGPCLINQMNIQGIQCSLKGFENRSFDQDVTNSLEGLILEKDLQMTVVSSEKEHMCVQLFDNGNDVTALLLAASPKVDLILKSSTSDDWEGFSTSGNNEFSPSDRSKRESTEFPQKRDSGNFSGDMHRLDDKENWRDCNQNNEANYQWSDKFSPGKKSKRDKENNWNDEQSWRDRGVKQDEDNSGDRRKFDGSRGGRFDDKKGSEESRFDRKKEWSNSSRPGGDSRKTFTGARNARSDKPSFGDRGGRSDKPFSSDRGGRSDKPFSSDRGGRSNKPFSSDRSGRSDKPFSGRDRKVDETRSARKPVRKEDVAPPGSKFEDKVFNIGTSENGIVTYYFSPDEFYVQLLDQEEEFKKMMHDIQSYYRDKYSLRDPVQAGDIVIAQFSLDKILYRAEVIKPSPVTVRYIDYGNQEPVGSKSTWLVDKQFLNLPKQVIKCKLANVQPVGSEWSPPGCQVDKFFEFEKYKFNFLGIEDDLYVVSMEVVENGKDVASEIIAAGLGQPLSAKLDVPKIDYSLLPKQILRLFVSHIESSSKFYTVLSPNSLQVIEEAIKCHIEKEQNLIPLDKFLLKAEMPCLSTRDGVSWHRGIIRKNDGKSVSVWFTDRGDCVDVTADKVISLPDHLKGFQSQAVECFLNEALDKENEEMFKQTITEGDYLLSIVSADQQRLGVVLYDGTGRKYNFQKSNDTPDTIEPIGYLPILCQKMSAVISHVESPKEIYIQRYIDEGPLSNLVKELAEFYEDKEDLTIEDGKETLVAAKSVADNAWYRGRLLSEKEDGFEIFYIDYGNKETVPRANVKRLDPVFFPPHFFTRKVSLDVECRKDSVEAINNRIFELIVGKDLKSYFSNEDGELVTEFTVDDVRVTDLLLSEDLVTPCESDKFAKNLPRKKVNSSSTEQPTFKKVFRDTIAEDLRVVISHIDSPKMFWVHFEKTINDLHEFQEKLQNSCQTLPEKGIVQAGDIVATLFLNMWYRAKVLNVDNNLSLQLVDYGKVLNSVSCNLVKELPPEFVNVPSFASCYALKGTWDESKTYLFEEIIVQSEEPVCLILLEEGNPPVVDLLQNGRSISEKLMEEPWEGGEEDHLSTVYMTHSNSPDDFYVQRERCTDTFNTIGQRLLDAETFENVSSIEENAILAAKFPEDGNWYRAKVIKKDADGVEVIFIDYGNTSKVSEVKCLPCELIDIHDLAENCSLVYGNTCDRWSEAACEKFTEFADRPLKMKVVVNRIKKPMVRLSHEGNDISEELGTLCESDGRSEVYVTHVQSPTDFYIRHVDDEQYKLVAEKLETGHEYPDLEDKQPGTLCLACFVDDGLWYRGKILKNCDEGCEIFFIDFGNVSVSTELKKLPPEIESIPPLALRCTLNLPETNLPESVKEEFINLTTGSEAVFRARVLNSGEVNLISLKLNGRILDNTLNIETTSYDASNSSAQSHRSLPGTLDDETDDDKNSKMNLMKDSYLVSNLEDDAKAESSLRNETDEEKRVKIAISGGEEGFKSDDEKGITEGRVLPGIVNATDIQLIEEEEEVFPDEGVIEISMDDDVQIVEETIQNGDLSQDSTGVDDFEENHVEETEVPTEDMVSQNKAENEENSLGVESQKRNKVHKIVPGSISRGEQEVQLNGNLESSSYTKLERSEKLVPGSISRGVSLESISVKETTTESPETQLAHSAPNTPQLSRKEDTNEYRKIDRNDRVVPGCISAGMTLNCAPDVEKLSATEKIVPGSVNGSMAQE